MKKATELGKSGNSVRVAITHLSQEHILSHKVKLIKEAKEIKDKLIENLAYIFDFDCSITNYLTPIKISPVIFFKKLEIKQEKYPELYSEFKETTEKIFKDSDFKIIQYRQIFNTIHIEFEHIPSWSKIFYKSLGSYLLDLKKRFLFNSNRLKEVISEKGSFYIYRIELLRKKYSFVDLGICKESKHLLIKYIKMLYLTSKENQEFFNSEARYSFWNHPKDKSFVYLELGTSIPNFHLKHLYNQIKEEAEFSPYLFLGRDKPEELSEGDLWIPRKRELENLVYGDILDRQNLILIKYTRYQNWREKHKISIKCEELNLFAYYMESEYNLTWDKRYNEWKPIPPPPKRIFKINKYLTLKLEEDYTNIYVKEKLFNHCKYLLFSFSKNELSEYEKINSIDEIKDKYDKSHENEHSKISPEVEFWGHCSNLQVWYEHNYDTRILHSNLAFPLLFELSRCGDPVAKKIFKEEIALRFESNCDSVIGFLLGSNYLAFLKLDEIETLSKNLDFMKWSEICFNGFFEQWIIKASNTQHEKEQQIRLLAHDIMLKRKGLDKELGKYLKIED